MALPPPSAPASATAGAEAVDVLVPELWELSVLWGTFPGVESLSQNFKSFHCNRCCHIAFPNAWNIRRSSHSAGEFPVLGSLANKCPPATGAPPYPWFCCPCLPFPVTRGHCPLKADGILLKGGQKVSSGLTLGHGAHVTHATSSHHVGILSSHIVLGRGSTGGEVTSRDLVFQYAAVTVLVCL